MRKIEKDMLEAIKDRHNGQSGNTRVDVSRLAGGSIVLCYVYLYNNVINASIKDGQMLIDGKAI